jgi:hypothetical protein
VSRCARCSTDFDYDIIGSPVTTSSNVRRSKGRVFVFDGVMILAAGSVLPHRQDVYHKFGLVRVSQFPLRSERGI